MGGGIAQTFSRKKGVFMALPTDPFRELAYFQRRMNRLLQENLQSRIRPRGEFSLKRTWAPKVSIFGTPDEILIFVELPGISSHRDVNLELDNNALILSGVRPFPETAENAESLVSEGDFGPFRRVVSLPEDIDSSSISAKMKSGLLEIRAQKKRRVQSRLVEIEVVE